ncbi:MAG: helix-turn-helix transcriptional regulator [Ruminococcus sp.]|nr:helix-turn-helix transcriptional regulator [Ruminococcus sp.]
MSKELGKALRYLRKQCELTQRQVADVLHIDRSTYAYYESGTTEPDLKSIRKLSQIFNVDPIVFLPNEDRMPGLSLRDVSGSPFDEVLSEEEEVLDLKDEKIYSIAKDERSMLIWYRTLTPEQKESLREFAQKFTDE